MVTARSGGSAPGTVTISGTAVDGSGAVLAGVTVDIAAGGVVAGIATTAANGTYSFSVASGQIAANAAVITYFADALHVGNYLDLMSSAGITGQVLKDGWLTVASGITTLSQFKAALDSAKGRLPAVNFADNYISGANVIAWRFNAPVFTIDQAFPEGNFLLDSAGTVTQTVSGNVGVSNLILAGGSFQLTASANTLGTISGNVGSLQLNHGSSLTVGSFTAVAGGVTTIYEGINATGSVAITAGATIAMQSGITSQATGDAVVLSAAAIQASATISTPTAGARWLAFLPSDAAADATGLGVVGRTYSTTLAGYNAGGTVGTGNQYVVSGSAPVIISGTAVDGNGVALANVAIDLAAGGVVQSEVVTGANGSFSFSLPGGTVANFSGILTYFADGVHIGNYLDYFPPSGVISGQVVRDGWLSFGPNVSTIGFANSLLAQAIVGVPLPYQVSTLHAALNLASWEIKAPFFSLLTPLEGPANLELMTSGVVVQTAGGSVSVNTLILNGGSYELMNGTANTIGTITGNATQLSLVQPTGITVGATSVTHGRTTTSYNGLSTSGTISISTSGTLTLAAPIIAQGAGDAVVLSAAAIAKTMDGTAVSTPGVGARYLAFLPTDATAMASGLDGALTYGTTRSDYQSGTQLGGGNRVVVAETAPISISGTALDGYGVPLSGVAVDIASGGTIDGAVTTGSDGSFSFRVASGVLAANAGILTYFADRSYLGNYVDIVPGNGGIVGQVLRNGWLTFAPGISTFSQASSLYQAASVNVPTTSIWNSDASYNGLRSWAFKAPIFTFDVPVTATGILEITSSGTVTQTAAAPISIGDIILTGGGNLVLTAASRNAIGGVAGNFGSLSLSQTPDLAVTYVTVTDGGATSSYPGISATGSVSIATQGTLSLIAPITSQASGDAVVLDASKILAQLGPSQISTPTAGARWLAFVPDGTAAAISGLGALYWVGTDKAAYDGGATIGVGNRLVVAEPGTITFALQPVEYTYGQSPSLAYTGSGALVGDSFARAVSGSPSISGLPRNAGTYAIGLDLGSLASGENYVIAVPTTSYIINKAPLTITATSASITYGQTPSLGPTLSGLQYSDSLASLSGALSFSGMGQNVGTYSVLPGGLSSSNYAITYVAGRQTVSPASLVVNAGSMVTTYGQTPGSVVTSVGLQYSDTLASLGGVVLNGAGRNVGTYSVTPSGLTSGNYDISYVPGSLVVNPAPLTVAVNSQNTTYGQTFTPTAQISGLQYGDTPASLSGSLVFAGAARNAGTYTVTASGLSSGNYAITFVPGTLAVAKAPLTATTIGETILYGQTPKLAVRILGFQYGDTPSALSGSLVYRGVNTNAGTYAVTAGGILASNYTLSYLAGTLVVQPAPLTVTAQSTSAVYGQTPSLTVALAGLVAGDTQSSLGGTLSFAGVGRNAGTYTITPGGFTSGNYVFSYAPGTLSVTPAPLVIATHGTSVVYGQTPSLSVDISGLQYSDTAASLGGSVVFSGQGSSAGSYSVLPAGLSAANYAISYASGTLRVTQAPLTVVAASTTKVEGSVVNFTGSEFTASGLLGSDRVTSVVLSSAGAGGAAISAASPYSIVASGAAGVGLTNYQIAYVNGVLTVTPAPIPTVTTAVVTAAVQTSITTQSVLAALTARPTQTVVTTPTPTLPSLTLASLSTSSVSDVSRTQSVASTAPTSNTNSTSSLAPTSAPSSTSTKSTPAPTTSPTTQDTSPISSTSTVTTTSSSTSPTPAATTPPTAAQDTIASGATPAATAAAAVSESLASGSTPSATTAAAAVSESLASGSTPSATTAAAAVSESLASGSAPAATSAADAVSDSLASGSAPAATAVAAAVSDSLASGSAPAATEVAAAASDSLASGSTPAATTAVASAATTDVGAPAAPVAAAASAANAAPAAAPAEAVVPAPAPAPIVVASVAPTAPAPSAAPASAPAPAPVPAPVTPAAAASSLASGSTSTIAAQATKSTDAAVQAGVSRSQAVASFNSRVSQLLATGASPAAAIAGAQQAAAQIVASSTRSGPPTPAQRLGDQLAGASAASAVAALPSALAASAAAGLASGLTPQQALARAAAVAEAKAAMEARANVPVSAGNALAAGLSKPGGGVPADVPGKTAASYAKALAGGLNPAQALANAQRAAATLSAMESRASAPSPTAAPSAAIASGNAASIATGLAPSAGAALTQALASGKSVAAALADAEKAKATLVEQQTKSSVPVTPENARTAALASGAVPAGCVIEADCARAASAEQQRSQASVPVADPSAAALAQGQLPADLATSNPALQALLDRSARARPTSSPPVPTSTEQAFAVGQITPESIAAAAPPGTAQAYTQAFVRALAKGKSFAEATADARAVALAQLRDSQAAPLAAPVASQSDTQTDDPTRR